MGNEIHMDKIAVISPPSVDVLREVNSLHHSPGNGCVNEISSCQKLIASVIQDMVSNIQPIYDTLSKMIAETVLPVFNEIANKISEVTKPFRAIEILADEQYVYWDYFDSDFVELILESENITETLESLNRKSGYEETNQIIGKCLVDNRILPYKKLFIQATDAFQSGSYELAVCGLLPIIDGLLSDVSKDNITNIPKRLNPILEKVKNNESLDNDEYALYSLVVTVENMMTSLSDHRAFSSDTEPDGINRHWILHGRSRRENTALDSVKLIRFIYGILLLDNFSREVNR